MDACTLRRRPNLGSGSPELPAPLQGSAAGRQAAQPAAQNTDVAAAHPAESASHLPLSGDQCAASGRASGGDTTLAQGSSPRYARGLPLSGGRHVTAGEQQRQRMLQELAKLGRGCASAASASMAGRYILLGVRCHQTSCTVVHDTTCSSVTLESWPLATKRALLELPPSLRVTRLLPVVLWNRTPKDVLKRDACWLQMAAAQAAARQQEVEGAGETVKLSEQVAELRLEVRLLQSMQVSRAAPLRRHCSGGAGDYVQ